MQIHFTAETLRNKLKETSQPHIMYRKLKRLFRNKFRQILGVNFHFYFHKNRDHYKKLTLAPNIQIFRSKSTISPLAANWSLTDQCFQQEKGVSLESRYKGTQIFTPCPQKLDFGPKMAKFGPKLAFWAKYRHF